jgi:hypothetical protein
MTEENRSVKTIDEKKFLETMKLRKTTIDSTVNTQKITIAFITRLFRQFSFCVIVELSAHQSNLFTISAFTVHKHRHSKQFVQNSNVKLNDDEMMT